MERGVTIKKRVHFIEEEKKERSREYYLKNKLQKVMIELISLNLKCQSQTVITGSVDRYLTGCIIQV